MVIGQQKGRDTKERRAAQLRHEPARGLPQGPAADELAEKFKLPLFTFVDTPGAYPGIDAEERGQSEAIGRNIFEMAQLEVPDHRPPSSAKAAPAVRWRFRWATSC